MEHKFKVGDILRAINPSAVTIQQCKILKVSEYYYHLLITESEGNTVLVVGYIHSYGVESTHKYYKLDEMAMYKEQLAIDMKEVFNG